jgi:hypothetical protein
LHASSCRHRSPQIEIYFWAIILNRRENQIFAIQTHWRAYVNSKHLVCSSNTLCVLVIFLGERIPASDLHVRLKSLIRNMGPSKSLQTQITLWCSSAFFTPEGRRLLRLCWPE